MGGGAEFAGPENGGPKIFNSWKMQDLENDGPRARRMPKYSALNTIPAVQQLAYMIRVQRSIYTDSVYVVLGIHHFSSIRENAKLYIAFKNDN